MKIALLTFHNAANYGAALQAYALQKFLDEKGFNTEYIDYQNETRRSVYDMRFHIKSCLKGGKLGQAVKYLVGFPFMQARKNKFAPFYRKLKCTKNTFYTKDDLIAISDSYDKYIVGSDQVWNPKNNGHDTAFLLSFVKDDKKKISYSSSFGLASIPDALKAEYANCLKSISHISSREKFGCKLIKDLTGRDAMHVLDPVFLLSKEHWDNLIGLENTEDFVFCYTNRENQITDFLRTTHYEFGNSKLYKLTRYVKPSDFLKSSVKVKYTMSPEEFLGNIRDSKMVITASFHCLALAIIFNKPFVCFITGDKGKDERVTGLLGSLGLMDRIYTPSMTIDDVNRPIDYRAVNKKKEELVNASVSYLLTSINS